MQNYYEDKTHISHSMLCDFVSYDKYGNRTITPEYYYAKHIAGKIKSSEPTDAMIVGTIVDRYISEGADILNEYPVVSRRSGKDPKEITNGMSDSVAIMTKSIEAFRTLQSFIALPDTIRGSSENSVLKGEMVCTGGTLKLKGKVDFYNPTTKQIVDLKTTGSLDTVMDSLQFKWSPNIFARYIRQGAYYRYLAGDNSEFALAIVDNDGRIMFVPIRPDILDAAFKGIVDDMNELSTYYADNWEHLVVDPFWPIADVEEDTL